MCIYIFCLKQYNIIFVLEIYYLSEKWKIKGRIMCSSFGKLIILISEFYLACMRSQDDHVFQEANCRSTIA